MKTTTLATESGGCQEVHCQRVSATLPTEGGKCDSLQILEELWTDYSSGHLGEMVQNCFVTEKILKELNLTELELKTTVDIEEYNTRKVYIESVALRGQAHLEKREQKAEVEESEKMKGLNRSRDAIVFIRGETLSAHSAGPWMDSARPRKTPGLIVLIHEKF
ncbi:hypothetical protein AWC38_SpisGene21405 [Stylophora pistillata]|uniref:TRADD-like N-terminal domain-containing protein n=1 Tax=Stylophora pistillata TaxID=50429 RepID=A0A2B4RCD8_STYPI|nr:hypothetical protein AWC38_SpisGene21405 [Stylophora pistillata]